MDPYEFTEQENRVFSRLSRQIMLLSSIYWARAGVLILLFIVLLISGNSVGEVWNFLFLGLLAVLLGFVWMRPSDNLTAIVRTSGHDIRELMQSVRDFNVAFRTHLLIAVFSFLTLLMTFITVIFSGKGGI